MGIEEVIPYIGRIGGTDVAQRDDLLEGEGVVLKEGPAIERLEAIALEAMLNLI